MGHVPVSLTTHPSTTLGEKKKTIAFFFRICTQTGLTIQKNGFSGLIIFYILFEKKSIFSAGGGRPPPDGGHVPFEKSSFFTPSPKTMGSNFLSCAT